jgi:oxygen-independent coproporphyrinogen-3 oxidase
LTVGNSRKHSAQTSIYMTSTSSSRMSTVTDASLPGERVTGSIQHLYVHIPFCARICPYCAFYKDLLDRSYTARFCEAIAAEIQAAARRMAIIPRTIFFGGGTPTALTTSQLEFLLNDMRKSLDLSQLEELTMEANPGSVSARKAALLRRHGVNRLSLGVQSWDDNLLTLLGREHNAAQAEQSFQILRAAGFANINIDLMFGLPTQTSEQWQATLEKTVSLAPEHISAYCLTYEEDTDFFRKKARGELRSNTDLEAELFELAMATLESAGYRHYEISNYAREGFASRHNRAYWTGRDYLGIGPSAFSTVGFQRWQNVANYRDYADKILSGESAIASVESLTPEMKRAEKIALMLRTRDGLPTATLAEWPAEVDEFMSLGLITRSNDHFVLTRRGKCIADSVAAAFV